MQAWLNEKFAPELLESKPEVIECVVEQLEHMVGAAGGPWVPGGADPCLGVFGGFSASLFPFSEFLL